MFIDIAFNATHIENNAKLDMIMSECKMRGIMPIFVGLDYESSVKSLNLSEKYSTCCYLGLHPCYIGNDNDTEDALHKMRALPYTHPRVIAVGECGLDYFRSTDKVGQKKAFKEQISLDAGLPYFYHCREAHADFLELIKDSKKSSDHHLLGVVHSFDGTLEEANLIIEQGLYIGINGCSLKTIENIEVVRQIPLKRILLETDSPFCLIRKSYAASEFVTPCKAKENTPVNVLQIALVLSKIKEISMEELEHIIYENTVALFPKIKQHVEYWTTTNKNAE